MKELLREFLADLLTEKKSQAAQDAEKLGLERKPGFGNYGPKGQDVVTHRSVQGKLVGVKDEPVKATTQAQPEKPEPTKPEVPAPDVAYTPPEGEKSIPKVAGNPNAKPIIKNKELDQTVDSVNTFNVDQRFAADGVSDKDFQSNPEVEAAPQQISPKDIENFLVDNDGKTLFPKKYVKVLSRLLSTKAGSLRISDFTDASGAGTLSSTTGELLTLVATSISDDQKADEFFKMIESHVRKNSKSKDSIIDVAWVKSAKKVRTALRNRYNSIYGEGQWALSSSAWDIKDEVESLGLPNYKENKGFSTDIYLQLTVDGKKVLDEISLKKDLKANLLNATSGRVPDIMVYGTANDEDKTLYESLNASIEALSGSKNKSAVKERNELIKQRDAIIEKYNADVPDEVKVEKVTARQDGLYQEYVSQHFSEIQEFSTNWKSLTKERKAEVIKSIVATMNQKDSYGKELAVSLDNFSKMNFSSHEEFLAAIKNITGKGDQEKKQKFILSVMHGIKETSPEGTRAQEFSEKIVKNSHQHSKAVRNFLLTDPKARRGLLLSIRDAFPLKALFEGEETMVLGDVVVDRKILTTMFQTEEFGEIEQKLTVRDEPPPPSIVYRVIGREDIPIAEISSRPDGIGYGRTWKLEMSVHQDFADLLTTQNVTTYPS